MQIFIYCKATLHVWVSQHPSSGVLKTVTAASGTGHNTGAATSLQHGLIRPRWREVAVPIQPDATVCRYSFTAKLLYMFRVSQHPSSGVLKTVTAASGTGHNNGAATALQRGLIRPCWREEAVMIQPDATVCRYSFTAKLFYMFRVSQHPSSGVLKTVPVASGTGHTTCTATPLLRGLV